MVRLSFISNKLSCKIQPTIATDIHTNYNVKRVFFYCIHGTNGDMVASMPFVNDIANKINGIPIEYAFNSHLNNNFKYGFVDNIKTHNSFPSESILNNNTFIIYINDTLYINTWFGQLPSFKNSKENILVQSPYGYYSDFKTIYDCLHIKLELNVDFYIPTLLWNPNIPDYSIIDISFSHVPKKKVLLCNGIGYTNPNQFPGESIANLLKYLFNCGYFVIVTNPEILGDSTIDKIYFSQLKEYLNNDIFHRTNPFYINEIYAKNCDIIIGSASGLFLSLMTTHTFEKKFVLYSNFGKYFVHERFNLNYITEYSEDTFISKLDSLLLSSQFDNSTQALNVEI